MAKKFLTQRLEHDEQRMKLGLDCYDPLPEKAQAECLTFYDNAPELCEILQCKDGKQRAALSFRFPVGFESPRTEVLYRNRLVGQDYFYTPNTLAEYTEVRVAVRVVGEKNDITMTGNEWLKVTDGAEPIGSLSKDANAGIGAVQKTNFKKWQSKKDAEIAAGIPAKVEAKK